MAWWIWVAVGIGLCVAEIAVPSFFILFFGVGAIAAGLVVAAGLVESFAGQLIVFAVLSIVLLLLFRSSVMRLLERKDDQPEPDSLVGEWAVAQAAIAPGEIGKVELRGTSWDGRNAGSDAIAESERCRVKELDGVKLVVIPKAEAGE